MEIWSQVQIPDHFSIFLSIAKSEILGDLLIIIIIIIITDLYSAFRSKDTEALSVSLTARFLQNSKLGKMTDVHNILEEIQQTSRSGLIRIQILDHFRLKFWHWQRFTLPEHGLVMLRQLPSNFDGKMERIRGSYDDVLYKFTLNLTFFTCGLHACQQ